MKKQTLINEGVNPNKIIDIKQPSVIWNVKLKKVMDTSKDLDLEDIGNGNKKITIENNRMVNVSSYNGISRELVEDINKSEGILFYEYNESPHFRLAFIPSK